MDAENKVHQAAIVDVIFEIEPELQVTVK